MVITLISDTHTKHRYCEKDLYKGQGDLLIHAGDFMNSGYDENDIWEFLQWFENQNQYKSQIFIAGNHDRFFQNHPEKTKDILIEYPNVCYLQDCPITYISEEGKESCKIYGSPWQPEFYQWAFNLPRQGEDLREKWFLIPSDTDILVTHGPAFGHGDEAPYGGHVGCELLRERIDEFHPKIHVFGHIHAGYGYKFHNGTHFFNASVLGETYNYENKPFTFDWNPETNEVNFL